MATTEGSGSRDSGTNQSVERSAAVLRAFLDGGVGGRAELRVADVARTVGLGVSTTSRLLATLESVAYVERDPVSQLYRLGPALITLGGAAVNQHPVHREARPVVQMLASKYGFGANVAIRRGDKVFYLLNAEGPIAGKSYTLMGQSNPLHATGLGKCLLLGLSAAERRDLLGESGLHGFTRNTITTHEALDDELALVGQRSYAMELEELAAGRACIAAPIRGRDSQVTAAISLSGPLSLLDLSTRETELAQIVIESADRISIGLGYLGPHAGPSAGTASSSSRQ
ncbi:IclR family transcriptional regulator [Actinoallomurus iriomotensis]|uniref:IclR family transcriptional regulator n=1 Tax=Actinoallomurus iriomotensis TaxID=478107 RepID=A0A9W6RV66_9ACTN|nr:IclR family transcriptional regulator [Actinoallomurus iriomotensis]GLY73967.1 IclR family transcriptional regulator [Actinoallomurus iriomotensis]GLY82154.1 IclR family transcriptional regulator [Actinoallomurus iriomotensis]